MPLMMQKRTTKNYVLFYLRYHPGWISNAELQSQAKFWQTTGSTIARRARELADDGLIERRLARKGAEYKYVTRSH